MKLPSSSRESGGGCAILHGGTGGILFSDGLMKSMPAMAQNIASKNAAADAAGRRRGSEDVECFAERLDVPRAPGSVSGPLQTPRGIARP